MKQRVFTALLGSLIYVLGFVLYGYAVHHYVPKLQDIPKFLETALGFLTAWLVAEWWRSRRGKK